MRPVVGPTAVERRLEGMHLVLASNERRVRRIDPSALLGQDGRDCYGRPRLQGSEPFRIDMLARSALDTTLREMSGELAHEDLSWCGGLLKPDGCDHRCTGREVVLVLAGAGDHLPRVDPDPNVEREWRCAAQLAERRVDPECRTDGSFRVILMRRRDPEDGHCCVANELLRRPTVVHQHLAHPCKGALEHSPSDLGIVLPCERRGTDDVGEERRNQLPLGGHRPRGDALHDDLRVAPGAGDPPARAAAISSTPFPSRRAS